VATSKHTLSGKAADALKDYDEAKTDHDRLCEQIDMAEDAYQGIYERTAEVANWTHKMTPRYVQHIVETTMANMLDDDIRFQVVPRPKLWEPGEIDRIKEGSKALQSLLDWQLQTDRFKEKQRDLVLQERLAGISWAKVYWRRSTKMKKRLVKNELWPQMEVTEEPAVEYDGPCIDICNNRDLVWDMGAPSIERCALVGHRIWVTFEEAKAYEKAGAWKNVDRLKDAEHKGTTDDKEKRKQNRFEVVEIWRREANGKIMVYTIGERTVLLSEKENPYWHGMLPFVPFSTQRKPLMLNGWSQIDRLKDLQEQLWSVENLTLDALMLSIMPVIMYREDLEDPDALVFEPYARWGVTDPESSVKMWTPEYSQASVGLPHIQRLQATLQNLAGGQPFTSTSEARTMEANTATEASLVASIGQRSIVSQKSYLYYALERIGQQMMELDQQYIRQKVWISIVDIDTPKDIEILPEVLQGDFNFSLKPMADSLIRQEKRAEKLAFFQGVMQTAPVNAALAAQGFMRPLDYERIYKELFEAYEMDSELFFKDAPPPQIPGSAPGAQPGQPGVTNPQAAAGNQAPSNANSLSPMAAQQQFFAAQSGGGNQ
jgi:hypothetical protein